jgi:hypothetical protein
MGGNASISLTHPLGPVIKNDDVIIGEHAFVILAGMGLLQRDGSLVGNCKTQAIAIESVGDLHDAGFRVFEVSDAFIGKWR